MANMANIPDIENNNCLLFQNNVKYMWAKLMQANKMIKSLVIIFFNNLNLASIRKYLCYKNMDIMTVLLIKLLYSKVI